LGEFVNRVREIIKEKADEAKRYNDEFSSAQRSLELERYRAVLSRFPGVEDLLRPDNVRPVTKTDEQDADSKTHETG